VLHYSGLTKHHLFFANYVDAQLSQVAQVRFGGHYLEVAYLLTSNKSHSALNRISIAALQRASQIDRRSLND
jgi:hypothetical protein